MSLSLFLAFLAFSFFNAAQAQCSPICTSCSSGEVLVKHDFIANTGSCISCSPNCDLCQPNRVCLQCAVGYQINPDTNGCMPSNTSNYYFDCITCPSNCISCVTDLVCTKCQYPYSLNLLTGTCYQPAPYCPRGFYYTGTKCELCSKGCSQCNGPNIQDCFDCFNGSNLYSECQPTSCKQVDNVVISSQLQCGSVCSATSYLNEMTKFCDTCQSGFYYDSISSSCKPCGQNCLFCFKSSGSSLQCLSCSNGYEGYSCNICSAPKYINTITSTCDYCNENCGSCSGTSNNCLTCLGNGRDITQGCKCKSGFSDTFNGVKYQDCIQQLCSSGYYATTTNQCVPNSCSNQLCQTCESATNPLCAQCKSNIGLKFYLQGKCLNVCPHDTKPVQQADLTYKCIPICATNGWFLDSGNSCSQCIPHCQVCSNSTTCTQCSPGYTFANSICQQCYDPTCSISCSASQYYSNVDSQCHQCLPFCLTCNGPNTCTQCQQGYTFQNGQCQTCNDPNCTTTCPNGQFYNNSQCNQCSYGCLTCTDAHTCNACQDGFQLVNHQCEICFGTNCQNTCPVSTYYSSVTQKCESCPLQCQVCRDSNSCDICVTGYTFQSGECRQCNEQTCSSKRKTAIDPIFQPFLLLILCIFAQFYAFALSMDILQTINETLFISINHTTLLANTLSASDFSNFRFFPTFATERYGVPFKFADYEIDSMFISNMLQPLSIWLFSFLLYLFTLLIQAKNDNLLFRLINSYKQNYFYFIISGVAFITFTRSIEVTYLQLNDYSSLSEPFPLISYVFSLLSIAYFIFYIFITYKAILYKPLNIFDNLKLSKKYSFFVAGLKNTNKLQLFYLIVILRKVIYTYSIVFLYNDGSKQAGVCNLIIGLETVLLANLQPFKKQIEYKVHMVSRILLLIMLTLIQVVSVEQQTSIFNGQASVILQQLTAAVVIMNYFLQVAYNIFIQYKSRRSIKQLTE